MYAVLGYLEVAVGTRRLGGHFEVELFRPAAIFLVV